MATGALIVERINDVLVLFFFISLVGIFASSAPEWIRMAGFSYLSVIIILYLIVMILSDPLSKRIRKFNTINSDQKNRARWLLHKIATLMEGISCLRDFKTNFILILISICIWTAVALGFYFYLDSFFPSMHWTVALAVMGAVNLSSLVSLVPGNLGMFELTSVAMLVIFSIPAPDAIVATIGYHSIMLLFTVLCGSAAKIVLQKKGQRLWEVV